MLKKNDDDDEYLYGSAPVAHPVSAITEHMPANGTSSSSGHAAEEAMDFPPGLGGPTEDDDNEVQDEDQDSEEEEDVEFILDAPSRSIDFRSQSASKTRTLPPKAPQAPHAPQPSLTTEYTPIQRGGTVPSSNSQQPSQPHLSTSNPPSTAFQSSDPSLDPSDSRQPEDGIDPSTLPPVTAPPSHPSIDPTAVGMLDGRSILEVDLNSMSDKAWRRPGTDISDYFNYGFDEISYEAYCYRRRDLGEMANVLKTNVLNFSGMSEDQVVALPPEVRQMVMTGTTTMMNGAANGGMMGPGVMMDMTGMMPMGMGMGGDMNMSAQMLGVDGSGMMMGDGTARPAVGNGPDQGMSAEAYSGNSGSSGMMGMDIQDTGQNNQQMYPSAENGSHVGVRPITGPSYRGAGRGQPGRGGFAGRSRGRGMYASAGSSVPVRSTSPLPPGVPTGPRNQNKYKDRDGNAQAVDGLDYGGNKDSGRRTPSGEPEDRSRKRRGSPVDEGRGSKRR